MTINGAHSRFPAALLALLLLSLSPCFAQNGDDIVRIILPDGTTKVIDMETYKAYFGGQPTITPPAEPAVTNVHAEQRTAVLQADDEKKATRLYQRACTLYEKGEYDKAISLFAQAAEHGSVNAQNYLGYIYYTGRGAGKDFARAFQVYMNAAERGSDVAQQMVGEMFRDGEGVGTDYSQAFTWLFKAAEQGNQKAQWQLAELYRDGKGVGQDYQQAARWYQASAAQGNAVAQVNLGYLYRTGKGVAQDDRQAVQWYRKSAEQGNSAAQNNLGFMYRFGYGIPQDLAEAEKWYTMAAAQDNEDARKNLAKLYEVVGSSTHSGGGGGQYTSQEFLEYQQQVAREYGLQIDANGNFTGGAGQGHYWRSRGETVGAWGLD